MVEVNFFSYIYTVILVPCFKDFSFLCKLHWHLCESKQADKQTDNKSIDYTCVVLFLDALSWSIYLSLVLILVSYCLNSCSFMLSVEIRSDKLSDFALLSHDCFGYSRSHCLPLCILELVYQFLQKASWKFY